MKKIVCFILCIFCILPTLASCSSAPEYSEIEARFAELIEASAEVNTVLFGKGLDTYERVYDPTSNTAKYTDEATQQSYYYYTFTDKAYGEIVAFRSSERVKVNIYQGDTEKYYYYDIDDENYERVLAVCTASAPEYVFYEILTEKKNGAEATLTYTDADGKAYYAYKLDGYSHTLNEYTYLQVLSSPDKDREAYYTDTENSEWYYLLKDYTEPKYEFFYDEDDPDDYDYVRADSKYLSINEIKTAASQVYSAEYLEAIYDSIFVGAVGAADDLDGFSAKYIEFFDDDGNVSLMQSNKYAPLISETRVYDLSTAKIVKPSNSKYVNITVDSYLPSNPESVVNVRISMTLQDGVWMLDSATY